MHASGCEEVCFNIELIIKFAVATNSEDSRLKLQTVVMNAKEK